MPRKQTKSKQPIKLLNDRHGGLCHRCEHRVVNIEDKYMKKPHAHQPRCECGTGDSKHSCYMYSPVIPVVLSKDDGDPRPMFAGSMFSARSHIVRVPAGEMHRCAMMPGKNKAEVLMYWRPTYPYWVKKRKLPVTLQEKKMAEKCDSCGKRHKGLLYRMMARSRRLLFNCWATCPETGEPILAMADQVVEI